MTLGEERVALGIKPLGKAIDKRNEKALVLAIERRNRVKRPRCRYVEASATVVAPPFKSTPRARWLRPLVALEHARPPRRVKPLPDAPAEQQ